MGMFEQEEMAGLAQQLVTSREPKAAMTLTMVEIENGWIATLRYAGDVLMAAFETQNECLAWTQHKLEEKNDG